MRVAWVAALAAACNTGGSVERVDRAPKATIVSPADQGQVRSGALVAVGRVSDDRDAPERIYTVWSLGRDGGAWEDVCVGLAEPDGTTRCLTEIGPEHTSLRLAAVDVAGWRGEAKVSLRVVDVDPPVVEILEPAGDRPYYTNVPVPVVASVHDPDHAPDELLFSWQTDRGPITGPVLPDVDGFLYGEMRLPEGATRLVLLATDPDGAEGRAEVALQVLGPDTPPQVRVVSPADGVGIVVGTPITLRGTVLDAQDAPDRLVAVWRSDRDGVLGEPDLERFGAAIVEEVVLSSGDHRLVLTGTDTSGLSAEAEVTVHVDTPPSVVLTKPVDGAELPVGQPVLVEGVVSDARTPAEALVLSIRAEALGSLGLSGPEEDGTFQAWAMLPPGTHTFTVRVTDEFGLWTEVVRTVTLGDE